MAQVQCRMEIPKSASEAKTLTVGQVFYLNCEGEWPALQKKSLELRLEEADRYKLKLLDFEFTSKTEAQLKVTSYKVGQHQLKAVQLVDSENSVVLSDLDFTIQSVMNPQQPVTEPFGPFGPLALKLPLWFPLTVLLLFAILLGVAVNRWRIRREKRRLLLDMRLTESAQEPIFQFYQTIRKQQRAYPAFSGHEPTPEETQNFIAALNESYKIYLARNFEVPTLKWSERKILSDLKKNHRAFYTEFRLEVRKALAELNRALNSKTKMTAQDSQQLLNLLRRHVDHIQTWLKGHRK
ncbi:MAG: hypothetical protein ACAH59_13580 [Pseudobdellovibrionaceae bacterium]